MAPKRSEGATKGLRVTKSLSSHRSRHLTYAKQKHPGCKKSARPIRSSIVNRYVRPKTLISVEVKKLLIKTT